MPNREPDDELLAAALRQANDCPPLEDLERLLNEGAPVAMKRHVDRCSHCQTELQMLRSFTSNEVGEHEKTAVDAIAARLKARSSTIATRRTGPVESRHRAELWSAEALSPRIALPPRVGTLIVPSKTLLIQVAAFDASSQKIAESETVRFRLLQNVYTP